MEKKEEVLAWLQEHDVVYTLVEHPPAYTMQDIEMFGVSRHGAVCKNLFLRDDKGKRHFLLSVCGDKQVNLAAIGEALGVRRLGFASEERLARYLQLKKGAVTPLGVLFDKEHAVPVFLDKDLAAAETVGVHPCDNTATLFLAYGELKRALALAGAEVNEIDI